jgi:zinc/manganese transport system substrate-binding protein
VINRSIFGKKGFVMFRAQRYLRMFLISIFVLIATLLAKAAPKLKVVASTSDLESIIRGNQDPHFAEAKPSYLLKLRQADLLIVVGLQLEGAWLTEGHHRPSLMSQSGNPRIQPGASGYFDASQYAEILGIPSQPLTPDIQPFGSQHYWLDPENGRRIAQALANKLSELQPTDASYFKDSVQKFSDRLSDAEKTWDAEMQPYHGRRVVTYHRSWPNFLKHFQLVAVGEIEPSPRHPTEPAPRGRHNRNDEARKGEDHSGGTLFRAEDSECHRSGDGGGGRGHAFFSGRRERNHRLPPAVRLRSGATDQGSKGNSIGTRGSL